MDGINYSDFTNTQASTQVFVDEQLNEAIPNFIAEEPVPVNENDETDVPPEYLEDINHAELPEDDYDDEIEASHAPSVQSQI